VIFNPILFCASRSASGVGNAEAETVRVLLEEAPEKGGLPCTAGARYDDWAGGEA